MFLGGLDPIPLQGIFKSLDGNIHLPTVEVADSHKVVDISSFFDFSGRHQILNGCLIILVVNVVLAEGDVAVDEWEFIGFSS